MYDHKWMLWSHFYQLLCCSLGPDIEGEIGENLGLKDVIAKLNIQPLKYDGKYVRLHMYTCTWM